MTAPREVDLRPAALDEPVVRALIEALNAELSAIYPEPGANHFHVDPSELAPGRGVLLVAWRDGGAVGCGALRRLDAATGELKRMYVVPGARGSGVGRVLLDRLVEEARGLGLARLVLETGTRQKAAVALYAGAGFEEVPPFGEYAASGFSLCMARDL